jgi:hypothetical protein
MTRKPDLSATRVSSQSERFPVAAAAREPVRLAASAERGLFVGKVQVHAPEYAVIDESTKEVR